jgi:hypothetical protein
VSDEQMLREIVRDALTDEVMKAERLRVLLRVQERAADLLRALGLADVLDAPDVAGRLELFRELHHVPGDHLWQAMQFVFRIARDGGDERDTQLVPYYVGRIVQTLFAAPYVRHPDVPAAFWETPIGLASRIAQDGIGHCRKQVLALAQATGE